MVMKMKKTQRKYLFQIIRKNLFSFLATAIIITIGISVCLGIQFSAIAISNHVNHIQIKNEMISTSNDIWDIHDIEIVIEGLYRLSYCIIIIFFAVIFLICYVIISRMISEQRKLIGVQKVFGFTSKEIIHHYMNYSIVCATWGILQGICLAIFFVQELYLNVYENVFLLGTISKIFSWKHTIIISVFCMVVVILSTYLGCEKEIELPTTELLHEKLLEREKAFFFENWNCYQKLSLHSRIMIKDVLEDTSSMLITIMGIASCVILLVICFILQFVIEKFSFIQFEQCYLYENCFLIDRNIIAIVCFIFAVIMAILVVYNQMVIHINRKAKQLSIMRINGFTLNETKAFVSRENIILAVLGLILGNSLSIVLVDLIIHVMEVGAVHFVSIQSSRAFMLATLVVSLFTFIANKLALQKIHKLHLTDIISNEKNIF